MPAINRRFAWFAWGSLAYTVFVIIWGGFVRATGSGAGCGDHWPLCNGEVIPRAPEMATLIEYSHRITSGVAILLVLGLYLWARRAYVKGAFTRRMAGLSLFFMVLEALIGAGLVLFEFVAFNVSIARAYWMSAHLVNTLFLIGFMTLTAYGASGGSPFRFRGRGVLGFTIGASLVGTLVLAASGGIAALGDTLTIAGGISPAENAIVETLVGLRIYHPLLACVVFLIVGTAIYLTRVLPVNRLAQQLGVAIFGLFFLQMVIGVVNVWLMAPVWIQMVHLFVTNMIWIALVVFAASALADPQPAQRPEPALAGA